MPAQQQEKPMRHVMVFTRAFRTPLQTTFAASETDSLDDFCQLLEAADARIGDTNASRDSHK